MFRIVVALALLFCGSVLPSPVLAERDDPADDLSRIPEVHLVYYDVSGSSEDAIRNAIDNSPSRPRDRGRRVDAVTTWNFSWKTSKDEHGVCDPSLVEVTFTAEVVMPRLVHAASPRIAQDWNRYVTNLRLHEAGHVTYARSRLADVLAAAKSSRCEDINPAVNHILDAIREHDRLYDAETSHGLKQGAVFPQSH